MVLFIGSQIYEYNFNNYKSFISAIKKTVKDGANILQLNLRNLCSSSQKNKIILSETEIKKIKDYSKKNKIKLFVHGSYLLNFCKIPVGLLRIQWAYNLLREDMELSNKLGAKAIVIHMCSKNAVDEKWRPLKLSVEETIKRNINHLNYFLNENKNLKIKILLENSASEGGKIGGKLQELGKVYNGIIKKFPNKIGICIDTCHAFASGYDLSNKKGIDNFIKEYKKYVGPLSTLELIHLNDSKDILGSKKDRHAPLGKGNIFKNNIETLCYFVFKMKSIPMCLETHSPNIIREIKLVYSCFLKSGGGSKISSDNVIKELQEIMDYHRSLGNMIKAVQYGKAINSIKKSGLLEIESGAQILSLPFIGKGISSKVDELIKTGKISLLEKFKKDPKVKSYKDLTKVFGIGPKKARVLINRNILTISDLKKNDELLTKSQKIGLKYYNDLKKRIPRKESEKALKKIQKIFSDSCFDFKLAGSYKLGKKDSGDIDLIIVTDKIKKNMLVKIIEKLYQENILFDNLSSFPKENSTTYMGIAKFDKIFRHIDIHLVKKENLPYYMLYFGSGEIFSRYIRRIAKEKGYKLNEKGLFKNNKKIKVKKEKNICEILDI